MRVAVVLVLLGCNQVYDIGATTTHDARPIDAPFVCPTDRPLHFSALLHLVHAQRCIEFSTAANADLGVARCASQISEGPQGGDLVPSSGIDYSYPGLNIKTFTAPRLSADGTRLHIRVDEYDEFSFTPVATTYDVYRRTGTTWTRDGRLAIPTQPGDALSNLARADDGTERAVIVSGRRDITEWSSSNGTWTQVRPTTDLGLGFVANAMLSNDGLVLTVVAGVDQLTLQVLWASRASVAESFGPFLPLTDLVVPYDNTVFITSSCGRAYLAGVSGIYYAQQQ